MSKGPKYLANLKALSISDPEISDINAIEKEVYGANDRATLVMLSAMVEVSLSRLLSSVLRSDLNDNDKKIVFGERGALGTFGSQIVMAFALKLIGPITRHDLDLIRKLRNAAAHSRKSIGFDTVEIKDVCDHLKIPDLAGAYIPYAYLESVAADLESASDMKTAKTRYIATCHNVAHRLFIARGEKGDERDNIFKDNPVP